MVVARLLRNPSLFTQVKIVEELLQYKVKERIVKVERIYKKNKEIEKRRVSMLICDSVRYNIAPAWGRRYLAMSYLT
ncbi:MAG: hypothetical protein ACFFAO_01225 [Candidatus Hermodarchaeota archaeon]